MYIRVIFNSTKDDSLSPMVREAILVKQSISLRIFLRSDYKDFRISGGSNSRLLPVLYH